MLPSRRRRTATARNTTVRPPDPHPSGARPPAIPLEFVPQHVAIVMDGNGRWANARGLPRVEGHKRGEEVVLDVLRGAIEIGVKWVSLYAFSTENWKRSPDEVRFLMNFNRDVIHRRVDTFDALGIRVRWAGRLPKLWRSVVNELQIAEERTKHHDVLNLTMCVNYGGRAEVADAARKIAQAVAAGELDPDKVSERTLAKYMYQPDMPDVDLFIRPSGEQRISNFMLWQSAYAELVFQDILWPDFNRMHLWRACENYARRDRRFGGAVDATIEADADENGESNIVLNGEADDDEATERPVTVLNGADLVQPHVQPEEAR
jgi:undecaprenyl diphosphate synthase